MMKGREEVIERECNAIKEYPDGVKCYHLLAPPHQLEVSLQYLHHYSNQTSTVTCTLLGFL